MKIKKLLCVILLAVLFSFPSIAVASSSVYKYDVLEDGTARITEYTGKGVNIKIPEELDGFIVTAIGNSAFKENAKIKTLSIPASVNTIENCAFEKCTSLNYVEIDSDTLEFGMYAFYKDTALEEVIFNASENVSLGISSFANCDRLEVVTFADSTVSIDFMGRCLMDCISLNSLIVPDTVETITVGNNAFTGDEALEAIPLEKQSEDNADEAVNFVVTAKATCSDYNHVGKEWTKVFYLNGQKMKDNTGINLKKGDTVKIEAIISEDDKSPDIGKNSVSYTVTDTGNSFDVSFDVEVEEDKGRYAGCSCTWKVNFRFEK